MEGFNLNFVMCFLKWIVKVCIGIFGNNENYCIFCDLRIGFGIVGSYVGMDDINSCGNEVVICVDNGD